MAYDRRVLHPRCGRLRGGSPVTRRRQLAVGLIVAIVASIAWALEADRNARIEGTAVGYLESPLPSRTEVRASSAGVVRNLIRQYQSNYGSVAVTNQSYSIPIFVASAGQELVKITPSPGCNDFTGNTGTGIPIPPAARPAEGTDAALVVTQPSTDTEWELWQAGRKPDGSWSACWGGKLAGRARLKGVFPAPYGLSASGISYLDTVVTETDVQQGEIRHVLSMSIVRCNGMVPPADRTDCSADPGQPSEGSWFRLPARIPIPPGLTPFAQMVFRALQRYGVVVTDRSGAVAIGAEDSADWTAEGHSGIDPLTASFAGHPSYSALDGVPWSRLNLIEPPAPPR